MFAEALYATIAYETDEVAYMTTRVDAMRIRDKYASQLLPGGGVETRCAQSQPEAIIRTEPGL